MDRPDDTVSPFERAWEQAQAQAQKLELKLFIAGMGPRSTRAIADLKQLCRNFGGQCRVEIVDIYEHPSAAIEAQIFAVPALVRNSPLPRRKLIGAIGDTASVAYSLGLELAKPEASK